MLCCIAIRENISDYSGICLRFGVSAQRLRDYRLLISALQQKSPVAGAKTGIPGPYHMSSSYMNRDKGDT